MKLALTSSAVPDFGGRTRGPRSAMWVMLGRACPAAACVHIVFLALFASLGLPLLVWVNIASIAVFVGSRALLSRRRNWVAVSLIAGEVVLHAIVATRLLGWDSGFHYYLLTLVGPLVVAMRGSTAGKLVRLFVLGAGYAVLDAWSRQVAPVYRLEPIVLDAIRYFNLAGMLAIMAFVSLTFYRLVASAQDSLRRLASTDPLTGLHNRRHLLEIARAAQVASPAVPGPCVLMCDIDHFKHVNDRHGHEMGDLVLQRVAAVIAGALRTTDSLARWGGEEFVALLPGVDLASAMQTGERVRRAVESLPLHRPEPPWPAPAAGGQPLPIAVTITIGVSRVEPAETIDTAIARADAALYRGKAAGRNRVVAGNASGEPATPPLAA